MADSLQCGECDQPVSNCLCASLLQRGYSPEQLRQCNRCGEDCLIGCELCDDCLRELRTALGD